MGSYNSERQQPKGRVCARARFGFRVFFLFAFLASLVVAGSASADPIVANLQPVQGVPDLLRDPNSYTIAQIIEAGGIIIGDKLFDSFNVTTTKSINAIAPNAAEIAITPIQVLKAGSPWGGDYGMRFNGLWSAPAQGLADSTIEFRATILTPGYYFKDNELYITAYGVGQTTSPGFVAVSENIYAQHPSSGKPSFANKFVYYSTPTDKQLFDSAEFSPISQMWVVKDVGANGGIGTLGVAHLSEFYQTFSQVPEPGSLALLMLGAVGLGGYVFCKRCGLV